MMLKRTFIFSALLLIQCYCFSQPIATTAIERLEGMERKQQLEKASLVNQIRFRNIGPSIMGGRAVDVDVNPENPNEFYLAYATGGVWYTVNNGQSFTPITDSLPAISIGDIAVNWKENIIWVGTGEATGHKDELPGLGIFQSKNKGKTWQYLGLPESHHIAKILLHPKNKKIAWVAVMGRLNSASSERGVYKTKDGGVTWKRLLFIDDSTGVTDLDVNPKNNDELFAASWRYTRKSTWVRETVSKANGIYKSVDGGLTWKLLTGEGSGFLTDSLGRIGISIYPKDGKIIYALVDNRHKKNQTTLIGAEIYRSENGGESWTKMGNSNCYGSIGWFFGKIQVSPTNPDKVIIGGRSIDITKDGGKTFSTVESTLFYADQHAIWINPNNDNHFIVGNDGGCFITYDNGKNCFKVTGPTVAQYNSIAVDDSIYTRFGTETYNIYGGIQDHHVWVGPSTNMEYMNEWMQEGKYSFSRLDVTGDGMQVQVDNRDNVIVYAGYQYGTYYRINLSTKESVDITPKFSGDSTLRTLWETPIHLSKHNQDVLYYGANRLCRSLDRGNNFEIISPDLTKGQKGKLKRAGALTTINESPLKFGLLYTGSDDGFIHLSKDGGISWKLINNKKNSEVNLPKNLPVSRIQASRYREGRVYVAMNGTSLYDHYSPYLYISDDYGDTWKAINKGLPFESIYVIREDPKNENILYLGTEGGLYVSLDRGESWMVWNKGLPKSVPVKDIAIQERQNEIVLGTFGRSLYIAKLKEVQGVAAELANSAMRQ